jgi:hypothetical protein
MIIKPKLFQNLLIERTQNQNCIVIDVQPEYEKYIPWMENLMQFLNKQRRILILINAEYTGLTNDSTSDVKKFWKQNGFSSKKWIDTQIFDKGYGYLRSWMDYSLPSSIIIKVIREMYRQRVSDSRDLFTSETYEEKMKKQFGIPKELVDESISVNWISILSLRRFNNSLIMGGARNECLREVQLLMNAFNIRYREVAQFIYE